MNAFEISASINLDIGKFKNMLKQAKSSFSSMSDYLKSSVNNAKGTIQELPEKASEALKETGKKLKGIAETVAKVGTAAVGAASAAVVAFGKKTVDAGMDFDKSMSQVAATMGKSVEEVSELREFAQEMGRTTAFSAKDSADALNYMALAGYDAETSMKMLPNVLNLAAAGNMDLALASDMITDSQSALGLSLDETTQLVDKMAKASSKSNTSVSQLGDAILTVGGTAKKLKGGTTELATVLGILADNGIKGSEGGTALRNIINSLISPTDDARAMLDAMGASLYDSEGNMRSLNDVFTDLRNGMSGLATQAEKDQVLTTIFNSRDLKSAEALIANVGDRFNELSTEIDNSANAADAMAKTQLDNLAGDVTLFKSALEGAQIAVSDNLTPALRDFVKIGSNAMSDVALAFSNSDSIEEAVFKMGRYMQKYIYEFVSKITDAIPTIITVASTLVNLLGQAIVKNVPKLANSAVGLLKGFAESVTKNAPTAIKGFSDMLKSVSDWLKKNGKSLVSAGMEMIKSIVKGLSENMDDMSETVAEIIVFISEVISDNLSDIIDCTLEIIGAVGQGIIDNLPKLTESALNIVTSLGEYLIDKAPILADKAPEIIDKLVTALKDCGGQMVTAADELITKFADTVGLSEQWENLKTTIGGAFEKIRDSVSGSIGEIQTSFENMKKALSPVIKNISAKLSVFKDKLIGSKDESGLLEKAIDGLSDIISDVIGALSDAVTGIMDFVTWLNSGSEKAEKCKDAIESITTAIGILLGANALKSLISLMPVILGHIVTQTSALVANAAAWIASTAPILAVGAILALIIYDIKQVIDNFDELKEFFPIFWEDIKNGFTEFGDAVGGAIYDFVEDKKAAIKQFFTDIGDAIGGWIYNCVQEVKNFFGNVSDGAKMFIDGISEDWSVGIQSIKNFFTGLRDHINTIVGAIGRFISCLVDNWKSGVQSIKNGVNNIKNKISEIPSKFGELVDSALSWGRDMIDNFINGIREKAENLWAEVQNIAQGVRDFLGFSEPEKGPLSNFHTFAPDMIDLFTKGIKENKKSIFNEIESVTEGIKDSFSEPITVNTGVNAKGTLNGFEVPDILSDASIPFVADGGYMTKYNTTNNVPVSSPVESPIVVENMNINLEGMNFSSEYEMNRFINFIAERLKAKNMNDMRGIGGVMF